MMVERCLMKNPKNLTWSMKIKLAELGLNPKEWQYIKNTPQELVIVNKQTHETKPIKL
jgi:hypothetical protein